MIVRKFAAVALGACLGASLTGTSQAQDGRLAMNPFMPVQAPMIPGAPQLPPQAGAQPNWVPPPPGSTAPPVGLAPNAGGIQEPTPIFQAPPGPNPNLQPPPLPPNAWPTTAPYNNYSRVAYPNLYPYEAWPYIGPFYPFPRVPLGWRSVSLTWQDGHWWYGRNATGHDWWRIRYH